MKKLILIILILISGRSFSQIVSPTATNPRVVYLPNNALNDSVLTKENSGGINMLMLTHKRALFGITYLDGNDGFGVSNPTGRIHLPAGGTAAGTGQLKFTSGSLTTTPEIGLMSFQTGLWFLDSSNSVRDTIATRRWVRNNITGGGGSGITELTGDGTAGPGSGSQALTLATVNSNVGSFTNASITVNAKGLITAASNGSGGSGTPGGNYGNVQINRNGLFTSPGSDSLDFEAGLLVKGFGGFTTYAMAPMIIGGTGTTSTLTYKTTTGVGASGADHIWLVGNNGDVQGMRMFNDGTMTIGGTTSAGYLLNIQNNSAATLRIRSTNASLGAPAINLSDNGTGVEISLTSNGANGAIGTYSNHPFQIATNNNAKMTVLTGGNVGIAEPTPTEKLHVVGNFRLSAAFMPDNLPGTIGQRLTSQGAATAPIWDSTLKAGTYIPTITGTSNLAASTDGVFEWTLIDGWYDVTGEISLDPSTTATLTVVRISLPISSSIPFTRSLIGFASDDLGTSCRIRGDTGNNEAQVRFTPVDVTNRVFSVRFRFKYVAP